MARSNARTGKGDAIIKNDIHCVCIFVRNIFPVSQWFYFVEFLCYSIPPIFCFVFSLVFLSISVLLVFL